jgi:hypothetical protein
MPQQLRTGVKDYYDIVPSSGNAAGDIWSGLPTFGILGSKPLPGIVITPACDLSNRKVETITYLPIIPARAYFATLAFMPDVFREIEGQLQAAQLGELISQIAVTSRFCPPDNESLKNLENVLESNISKPGRSEKGKSALQRVSAGIRLLTLIANPEIVEPSVSDLRLLLGERNWKSTLERLVGNAYRLDVHFLPADEQPADWAGVPQHSVALFRYALSVPVEIFESAQDIHLNDWAGVVQRLAKVIPVAQTFHAERPMKRVALRPRFLADLLTRYVAMHVRLGSPDFTSQTISQYVDQIGGN